MMKTIGNILLAFTALLMSSCVHEFTVVDNSFEFAAEVTYDDSADEHRLTLTRKSGAESNQYKFAFTLDGEATLSLTDMNGMTHEGSFKDTFDEVSTKTYTLSRVAPGEHTLEIVISTAEFSQSLSIDYLVEDFSFRFEAGVSYDTASRIHSLVVTLKDGSESDRYKLTYYVDQDKTVRTHEDTFTRDTPRTYDLSELSPGEHMVHLKISTPKYYQELEITVSHAQETFRFEGMVLYDEESDSHSLQVKLLEGRADDVYTVSYSIDNDKTSMTSDEIFMPGIPRTYPLESKPAGEHIIHLKISTPRYNQSLDIPYTITPETFLFEGKVTYDKASDIHALKLTMIEGRSDNVYTVSYLMDNSKIGVSNDEVFSPGVSKTYTLGKMPVGDHIIHLSISTDQYTQTMEIPFSVAQETFLFDCTVIYNEEEESHSLRLKFMDGRESNRYMVSYWIDNETDKFKSEDIFSIEVPRFYSLPKRQYGEHVLHVEISAAGYTQSADIPYTIAQDTFLFEVKVVYDEDKDMHHLSLELKEGKSDTRYRVAYSIDDQSSAIKSEDVFDIGFARLYELPELDPGEHTVNVEISNDDYTQTADIPYTIQEQTFRFASSILFDEDTKTHSLRIELKEGRDDVRYSISYTIDNQEPCNVFDEMFLDEKVRVYDLPAKDPGLHIVNLKITTSKASQMTDVPYTVKDYSFKVNADIEYDSDNLSHILFLTLLSGSREENYTINYTVDGGHGVKLTDASGKELSASFTESFKDATVQSYDLSRAAIGKHTMKLDISTKDYSQTLEIPFEVVAIPFSVHSEINTTDGASTKMLLSLQSGDNALTYNVSILYDGEAIKGYDNARVNFSSTPIKTLTLPLLRPGKHDVTVKITDGYTTQTNEMNYNEPVRHPYVDITLKHNKLNGRHEAVIGDNPYGIELTLKTFLTLTGTCTYCTSTYEYYESDITYASKTKLMSDSSTSTRDYDDITISLIDRDGLAAKMTSSYEMSNKVEYFYDPGSGGEDSGREWWEKTGTEKAYYVITKEDLKIEISGEKVSGVTIRVKNEIGAMTLNGKSNSSGTTNISL